MIQVLQNTDMNSFRGISEKKLSNFFAKYWSVISLHSITGTGTNEVCFLLLQTTTENIILIKCNCNCVMLKISFFSLWRKYAVFMQQMIIPQSFVIYVTNKMEVLPLKYNFDDDEVFHIYWLYIGCSNFNIWNHKFTHFCFCWICVLIIIKSSFWFNSPAITCSLKAQQFNPQPTSWIWSHLFTSLKIILDKLIWNSKWILTKALNNQTKASVLFVKRKQT